MTTQNLDSITVSQEDEDDVIASIDRILARIKFVSLGAEDRRRLRMMKAQRADYVQVIIRTLQQHPSMVPPGLDLAGAIADLEALERIQRIDDRIQHLATHSRDTRDGLGSDVLAVADVGYKMSKTFGPALGLGDLVKEIRQRFARPRKKKSAPEPDSTE